ncbi:MAG: glycosyltransferase family 2 protein [Spirochaetales bacterium]|nr:glycosyltransferase family 2 protein [Spirochaetales bacterium]
MIKYSFVIPAYNNKRLLKNTLIALNYQENFGKEDYEVVIIDDGSDDNTEAYISDINKNYACQYIYIERDEKSCRSRARNYGWNAAKGGVIIFIDSDILINRNYLKEIERCFDIDDNIILFGTVFRLKEDISLEDVEDGSIFKQFVSGINKIEYLEERHIFFNIFSYNNYFHPFSWSFVFSGNVAVSRKNLKAIGGFDEAYVCWGGEDTEWGYRAYNNGLRLVYNHKLEALHQYHQEEIQKKNSSNKANLDYFFRKHPQALSFLPEESRYKVLSGFSKNEENTIKTEAEMRDRLIRILNDVEKNIRDTNQKIEITVALRDKNRFLEIKEIIDFLSKRPGILLIVKDYNETGNLDVWIQLMGKRESTPMYYPMNREKFDDFIRNYRSSL